MALAPGGALRAPAGRGATAFSGRELDDIERGATLHDIGKIGVRDAVLLKPGPLDAAGMGRRCGATPALGYEILQGDRIPGARPRMIPLHHQERWDGTGYPQGLGGQATSASARASSRWSTPTTRSPTTARTASAAPTRSRARRDRRSAPARSSIPEVVQAWLRIPQAEWDAIRARGLGGNEARPSA